MVVYQHRIGDPWHIAWVGEIPSLHLCKEVYIITDHQPLVRMVSKDITTLSQQLQCIMLCMHKYSICIQYKPGPDLYIADWLSCHNHTENRDQEIAGMSIGMHKVTTVVDFMSEDTELQMLQAHIIKRWPQNKDEIRPSLGRDWPIRHALAMINGAVMKGKCIIIPFAL